MAIQFVCPNCRGTVAAPETLQGRKGQCPYCRQITGVPSASVGPATPAVASSRRLAKTVVAVATCIIVIGAIAGIAYSSAKSRLSRQTTLRGKTPLVAASSANSPAGVRSSTVSTPAQPQRPPVTVTPPAAGAGYGPVPASPSGVGSAQPPVLPPASPGASPDLGPSVPAARPVLAEDVAGDWETDIHETISFVASGPVVQSGTFRFAVDPTSVQGTMSDFRPTGDQLEFRWRYRSQSGPGYVARRGADLLVVNLWSDTTVAMTPYSQGSSPNPSRTRTDGLRNRRLGASRGAVPTAPATSNTRYGSGAGTARVIPTGRTGTEYALRRRAPVFEVTSLKPDSAQPGQSLDAKVEGKGFEPGVTCDLGDGMDASTTFIGVTSLGMRITVAQDASAGFRHLRVVNWDGKEAILRNAFRVLPGGASVPSSYLPRTDDEEPQEDVWSGMWETLTHELVFLTQRNREVSGRWMAGDGTFDGEIASASGVRGKFNKDGRSGQMTLLLESGKQSARLVLDYGPNARMAFQLKRSQSR